MSPENPSSLDFDLAILLRAVDAEQEAFENAKQRSENGPSVDAESLSGPVAVGSV
jgi:hypothetical protein